MTATLPTAAVTEPGVYDLPDDVYHRDPVPGGSLSASGAKKLLPPSLPALFDYERRHPPKPKREFDLGHVAHKLVLGVGPDVVVVEADDWRTKVAQEQRKNAYAAGKVPVLAREWVQAQDMADVLRQHPLAAGLFNPKYGKPEQSLFWTDPESGVSCRARFDWFPTPLAGRTVIVGDYKTCASAATEPVRKAINTYRYHLQAAWYVDGIRTLGIADDPGFVFVFQEKTPPYLVRLVQLDDDAYRVGRDQAREAISTYVACTETGVWPGYPHEIETVALPAFAVRDHDSF